MNKNREHISSLINDFSYKIIKEINDNDAIFEVELHGNTSFIISTTYYIKNYKNTDIINYINEKLKLCKYT